MINPTDTRAKGAAAAARDAFFTILAERYPEIRTGDVPPREWVVFSCITDALVQGWLEDNGGLEGFTHDQLAQASGTLDAASKGGFGRVVDVRIRQGDADADEGKVDVRDMVVEIRAHPTPGRPDLEEYHEDLSRWLIDGEGHVKEYPK